jgi:hypothetical protein
MFFKEHFLEDQLEKHSYRSGYDGAECKIEQSIEIAAKILGFVRFRRSRYYSKIFLNIDSGDTQPNNQKKSP